MRVKNIQNTENKKEEIMHKTFALMAKKGIKEISMREIADACGVTKPVLYYYFKDKEDLCFQMLTGKMQDSNRALEDFIKEQKSFYEILLFIFSDYICPFERTETIHDFFLHLHSYAASNPRFAKRLDKFRNHSFNLFEQILETEYKKGNISAKGRTVGLHLILANVAHLVMHRDCEELKFGPDFPRDMAQMVLMALQYKGENNK